jgi:DNA-directed RNA polymerase specialized sigma subunit
VITIDQETIRLAQGFDQRAQEAVINEMKPIIVRKCKQVAAEWRDDAMQCACLGIIVALTKYDAGRSDNFPSFAKYFIQAQINSLINQCIIGPCSIPREIAREYLRAKGEEKKRVTLSNGVRVDDLDKLTEYSYLRTERIS